MNLRSFFTRIAFHCELGVGSQEKEGSLPSSGLDLLCLLCMLSCDNDKGLVFVSFQVSS